MTWLRGPPLLVACSDNKIADVKKLLALGADPQAAAPSYDERSPTRPSHSSCIFSCIHKGYFEVLEALLATGQYELVHQVQNTMVPCSVPPLMYLLYHWAQPRHSYVDVHYGPKGPLNCVRLLLEAGASLAGGCGSSSRASPGPPSPWAWPSSSAAARKSVESARTVYSILVLRAGELARRRAAAGRSAQILRRAAGVVCSGCGGEECDRPDCRGRARRATASEVI